MTGTNLMFMLLLMIGISCQVTSKRHDLDIYKLHIVSDIAYRFATTNVSSYLVNRANLSSEAEFKLTIPDEAFINKFYMVIDGEIYHGIVKDKAAAQKQYDDAKSRGQSAGQVRRRSDTKANIFEVQVNIAAESKVEFCLTYQELLQRTLGIYEHVINLDAGQVVKDLKVEVNIRESRKIVLLEVQELRTEHQNSIDQQENPHAVVERLSDNEAKITYTPDSMAQKEASRDGISGQFVVEYDVERVRNGGDLLVVDGYFVHFFAPSGLEPVPKDIMFILDVSGSMSGRKLEQLKIAMEKIIDNLRPADRFNIITFASSSQLWEVEGLLNANRQNLDRAKGFVSNLYTRGSTNINDALLQGISFLKRHKVPTTDGTKRPAVVIFLTDGMPNESESDPVRIAENLVNTNEGYSAVFSLGFGNDVDFDFLKSLSLQNDGFARKIYVNADPALQLQNFYQEVSTPLLSEVKIKYLGNAVDEISITETCFAYFFEGSEIVVAGKLRNTTVNNIISQVSAGSATGFLDLNVEANVTMTSPIVTNEDDLPTVFDVSHFTERLWAYLTIKKMLDKKLQTTDANLTAEANEEALELALQYQFVTPLTSMVVTKPNDTEEAPLIPDEPLTADYDLFVPPVRLGAPSISGPAGSAYGSPVGMLPRHLQPSYSYSQHVAYSPQTSQPKSVFNIAAPTPPRRPRLPKRKTTARKNQPTTSAPATQSVCLAVNGESEDIFQLIFDKDQDIVINGNITIPQHQQGQSIHKDHIYYTKIAIMHSGIQLFIEPKTILLNNDRFSWADSNGKRVQGLSLRVDQQNNLVVQINRVLRMKLKKRGQVLEIVHLVERLDSRCNTKNHNQNPLSIRRHASKVVVPLVLAHDQTGDCLRSYNRQKYDASSCISVDQNQWVNAVGKEVRYVVQQISQTTLAIEYRNP